MVRPKGRATADASMPTAATPDLAPVSPTAPRARRRRAGEPAVRPVAARRAALARRRCSTASGGSRSPTARGGTMAPAAAPGHLRPGGDYLEVCRRSAAQLPEVASLIDALEAILRGERARVRLRVPRAVDGERWFSAHCTPIGDGPAGALIAHVDVTDRVKAISALAQAAAHDELPDSRTARSSSTTCAARSRATRRSRCAFLDLDDFKLDQRHARPPAATACSSRSPSACATRCAPGRPGGAPGRRRVRHPLPRRQDAETRAASPRACTTRSRSRSPSPASSARRREHRRRVAAPGDGSPTTVLRDADVALYQAKGRGARPRRGVLRAMPRAARAPARDREGAAAPSTRGELEVRYQPQVDLVDRPSSASRRSRAGRTRRGRSRRPSSCRSPRSAA